MMPSRPDSASAQQSRCLSPCCAFLPANKQSDLSLLSLPNSPHHLPHHSATPNPSPSPLLGGHNRNRQILSCVAFLQLSPLTNCIPIKAGLRHSSIINETVPKRQRPTPINKKVYGTLFSIKMTTWSPYRLTRALVCSSRMSLTLLPPFRIFYQTVHSTSPDHATKPHHRPPLSVTLAQRPRLTDEVRDVVGSAPQREREREVSFGEAGRGVL